MLKMLRVWRFQALLGTIKTVSLCLFCFCIRFVSSPFRYYKNWFEEKTISKRFSVSSPFRYYKNIEMKLEEIVDKRFQALLGTIKTLVKSGAKIIERVSSPFRYYKNPNTWWMKLLSSFVSSPFRYYKNFAFYSIEI